MKIIGLTGGIGSGKSTVAQMFRDLGVPVYNSDLEARHLMTTSPQLKKAIVHLLGKKAYKNGTLNRSFIAKKAFKDTNILQALNAIVHPAVRNHFLQWAKQQSAPYIIQETALIFENESQDQYDATLLVTAPAPVRLQRVMARDKLTEQEVRHRMKNQMQEDKKKAMADFCIPNHDLKTTQTKVKALHRQLMNLTH